MISQASHRQKPRQCAPYFREDIMKKFLTITAIGALLSACVAEEESTNKSAHHFQLPTSTYLLPKDMMPAISASEFERHAMSNTIALSSKVPDATSLESVPLATLTADNLNHMVHLAALGVNLPPNIAAEVYAVPNMVINASNPDSQQLFFKDDFCEKGSGKLISKYLNKTTFNNKSTAVINASQCQIGTRLTNGNAKITYEVRTSSVLLRTQFQDFPIPTTSEPYVLQGNSVAHADTTKVRISSYLLIDDLIQYAGHNTILNPKAQPTREISADIVASNVRLRIETAQVWNTQTLTGKITATAANGSIQFSPAANHDMQVTVRYHDGGNEHTQTRKLSELTP